MTLFCTGLRVKGSASALGIGLGFSLCRDAKRRPFMLSATVDFPDDVGFGLYNEALLDEMMSQIKSMGVKRIYWLYYGDVDPQSYWAGTMFGYIVRGHPKAASEGHFKTGHFQEP